MPYKDPELRKEKQREYAKKYYEGNKVTVKAATKEVNKKARAEWNDYKATLSCTKCGQNHPATLDFHHIVKDESNRQVNKLTSSGKYLAAREEIKKCMVLCANCHRIHHHEERQAKKLKHKKKKSGSP